MSTAPSLVSLTTSSALGGAETSLLALLTALRRLEPRWALTVVAPAAGPLVEHCRRAGIPALTLRYPAALAALGETAALGSRDRRSSWGRFAAGSARALLQAPAYLRALRRTLLDCGATIVHSNGIKAHLAAALAKPPRSRLVWHFHDYVHVRPVTARLLRVLAHRADRVVANSDSVMADAAAALPRHTDLRRVYNGLDLTTCSPAGPALDLAALAGLPADGDRVRVGLVATFAAWKGHDVFIDALAALPRPDRIRAYIVGAPVYETAGSQRSLAELRAHVARRGLAGTIGFTGHVHDIPAALRSLDILVHASTRPEPFGMTIAEGMAAGRAVVAVRAGGAAELFEDGVEALGVPPGSAADLALAIGRLLDDAALRVRLGTAARAAACRRFAAERMAAEFRQVYVG